MKPTRLIALQALIFFSSLCFAQTNSIRLKSGTFQPVSNITRVSIDSINNKILSSQYKGFLLIQFNAIPTTETRKILSANGIELLDYLPENTYTVSVSNIIKLEVLQIAKARAIVQLKPEQKMESRLASGNLPQSAVKIAGTIDVWVSFPKTFSTQDVIVQLRKLNIDILSQAMGNYQILSLRLAVNRLTELASLPFIEYVQAAPPGDRLLNYNSRTAGRASMLNAAVADGGKGLKGEGVVVGVGDNADVQTHLDFQGRLINRSAAPLTAGHGHHTTGTVGGAGNGNEIFTGFAPKSTIISQVFNGIILNAPTYVQDYGMVITNNSYGDNIECGYYGNYDLYSRMLDQMAFDFPSLQNVFSAGNSGLSSCSPFLPSYHTVLGGYQSAKNVITVGATTDSGAISNFSSRGPVRDGRIKPEIVSMGQFVASTWAGNFYSYNNGTSMAAPAVTGGLALLYQRYRQLNGGANPKNGLMKALLCNGSTDRGNAGPDYQYGFGWMNLLRSVDMLENTRYFISNSTQANTNNHTVTVPANTAQLKVMLYWNDPAASVFSASTLVNDLDLEVADPSANNFLPKILDTSNAGLGSPAIQAADHRNNMEQIVIQNPAAGNYTLKVKGTAITQNPSQEYFLVYDLLPVQLKITAPAGGEGLAPSTYALDMMKISWDAYGFSSGTGTLEFSSDNGSSWSTIAAGVDINRTIFTWWVPDVATSQARVRITKDGSGESSMSNAFTIIGRPVVSLAPTQCEGYININWTAVPGITDYEVMMLKGDEMKSVAITNANSYLFSGLSADSMYQVTVRARINGKPGRRAVAITYTPAGGSCSGSISDNDLKLDAIFAPVSGRKFTSTELTAAASVVVDIKNLDDVPVNNFTVQYSINGGPFITENVSATIGAGANYTHTFSTTADLSAVGNYSLVAVVKNSTTDLVRANDTAVVLIKQLANAPLNLTSYFVDNIESASASVYEKDTMGLTGIDRYDYSRTTAYGRLRTFINSGIAWSGSKALSLDASRFYPAGNSNFLEGTFNLSGYSHLANEVRLDFQFNNHGQEPNPVNRVWIRGNDLQSWIEVYNLDDNQNDPGLYKKTSSIEISDLLAANGQDFGSSFQVRWGQYGQIAATDKENAAGYSFDDIRVYEVFNDLQMISIDEPLSASCGLTNASIIKVTVKNSSKLAKTNIPVKYRVNNGAWISGTIPSIAANSSVQFSFPTPADLSAFGVINIEAIVDESSDSFHDNDSLRVTVNNLPVISGFPYLQGFESNNGFWYAEGKHSSWEYGTPASMKINRAANGAKAWKTRLTGNYNDNEFSYLYSPCFDISGLSNPTLSFSLALDIEDCGAQLCDGAWVEYSSDGINWLKLGAYGTGTNWYNKSADQLWSIQDYTRWHVATIPLPTGFSRLRLRFVIQTDPAANREGIAIDDIHVYNNPNGIYDGVTMASPVTQNVSGNNWIDFTSSGKLVASIQPNNQAMGSTGVRAFIHPGSVRYTTTQYYHNRNITIQPANSGLTDSVTVRFYFLDRESDSLILATGCAGCSKPASAYELGISKYSDPDDNFENGNIGDNNQGMWSFIRSENVLKIPFDKGYYAEFKVRDFSEFWLNNGGFTRSAPLPVKLMDFTAQKTGVNDVLLRWKVGSETDVLKYEVELAKGNAALQGGQFVKIGELPSLGNTTLERTYSFTDVETEKFGPRYYRLKIINLDGSIVYSAIRSVVFNGAVLWQVYPNPSQGKFNLVYQLNNLEILKARIVDAKGSLIREYRIQANGFVEKLVIDLNSAASGVYLLEVEAGSKNLNFKLNKL